MLARPPMAGTRPAAAAAPAPQAALQRGCLPLAAALGVPARPSAGLRRRQPLALPTAFHSSYALPLAQAELHAQTATPSGIAPAPERSNEPAVQEAEQQQEQHPKRHFPWWSDEWKEEHRKEKGRVVFDFERWKRHRSSSRYWRHVASIATSSVVQGLCRPLACVMACSLAVGAYYSAAAAGAVPLWPALKTIASAPFGLTSFAVSLLLVFRTNTSYSRFDEARKLWGSVLNRSRDLVRQALAYVPSSQGHLQAVVCRWTIAFSRALMCHLREGEDLAAELAGVLPPAELAALLAARHRPSYCLQVLSTAARAAQLPSAAPRGTWDPSAAVPAGAAYRMDENLTAFADVTGACERILKTPIPLGYTRHTSRFLMLWLMCLPLTLWEACGWAMLPVVAIVSFLLLGIEEIGVQIEEPFSILPLESICRTIRVDVEEARAAWAAGAANAAAVHAWMVPPPQQHYQQHQHYNVLWAGGLLNDGAAPQARPSAGGAL